MHHEHAPAGRVADAAAGELVVGRAHLERALFARLRHREEVVNLLIPQAVGALEQAFAVLGGRVIVEQAHEDLGHCRRGFVVDDPAQLVPHGHRGQLDVDARRARAHVVVRGRAVAVRSHRPPRRGLDCCVDVGPTQRLAPLRRSRRHEARAAEVSAVGDVAGDSARVAPVRRHFAADLGRAEVEGGVEHQVVDALHALLAVAQADVDGPQARDGRQQVDEAERVG